VKTRSVTAVLGLGLIGGSVARARHEMGDFVWGLDIDAATARGARDAGVVDAIVSESLEELREAHVVVLAVPVTSAPALLTRIAPFIRSAELVMDVGSTKRAIVSHAESVGLGARFVGAHPMAGGAGSGWSTSQAALFRNARIYLCATTSTESGVLQRASTWWSDLGGRPEVIAAEDHDTMVAYTSHLPQVLSTLLAQTLAGVGLYRDSLGPGGRDMTRLSEAGPEMWAPILTANRDAIAAALHSFESRLAALHEAVVSGDEPRLAAAMAAGRTWFRGNPEARVASSKER
jgi:prephenate dehydrogenase